MSIEHRRPRPRRDAGPARRDPAGGVDRRRRHGRAGVARHARRARAGPDPVDRQPDRAVGPSASDDGPSRRRPVRPRARQPRLRGRRLRPRPRLRDRRPTGSTDGPGSTVVATERPRPLRRSTSCGLRVVEGRRRRSAARWRQRRGKLARHAGGAARRRRRGHGRGPLRRQPRDRRRRRGDRSVGRSSTDGVLVAAQPSGAPHVVPVQRPRRARRRPFRVTVTAASHVPVVVNGALRVDAAAAAAATTWVYEQAEPTSPYLMTLHIGRYDGRRRRRTPGADPGRRPAAATAGLRRAFARQTEMMDVFVELLRAVPVRRRATRWWSRPTRSRCRSRRRARPSSAPTTSTAHRAPHRPRAGPPVVRQQPHRGDVARHLAARGLRLLRRVALVRGVAAAAGGRRSTPAPPPPRLPALPQDLVLADPGPATCSTTASTSAAPSRSTPSAARSATTSSSG